MEIWLDQIANFTPSQTLKQYGWNVELAIDAYVFVCFSCMFLKISRCCMAVRGLVHHSAELLLVKERSSDLRPSRHGIGLL